VDTTIIIITKTTLPNIPNLIGSILDLAEKNYKNLVEALTNNAIDNADNASFSNLTLSLP
jgi:hypothetical protein